MTELSFAPSSRRGAANTDVVPRRSSGYYQRRATTTGRANASPGARKHIASMRISAGWSVRNDLPRRASTLLSRAKRQGIAFVPLHRAMAGAQWRSAITARKVFLGRLIHRSRRGCLTSRWRRSVLPTLACAAMYGGVWLCGCGDTEGMQLQLVQEPQLACVLEHPTDTERATDEQEATALRKAITTCNEQGGSNCDGPLISDGAARCLAFASGLEEGLEPVEPELRYDFVSMSITWVVMNVTVNEGPSGMRSGKILLIDAVTGELVDQRRWTGDGTRRDDDRRRPDQDRSG